MPCRGLSLGFFFFLALDDNHTNLSMTIVKCSAEEVMPHCGALKHPAWMIIKQMLPHCPKAERLQKYPLTPPLHIRRIIPF